MQEQINEKTVALSIKTAKLTAEVLQKAIRKMLSAKKNKAPKIYKGKQTLKHLMKQNTGVSSMEITDANIKAFEPIAKKYGLDYSLKKVNGELGKRLPTACSYLVTAVPPGLRWTCGSPGQLRLNLMGSIPF